MHTQLVSKTLVDNTNGFTARPGFWPTNRRRDALIWFDRRPDGGLYVIPKGGPFDSAPEVLQGIIDRRNERKIISKVQACRQVWKENVVDLTAPTSDVVEGGQTNTFPFRDQWDLSECLSEARSRQIMGKLARAGWMLFRTVFLEPENDELRQIGARLFEASQSGQLVLTFMSDRLFVPWSMFYTHPDPGERLSPDGSNYDPEGFWGYRHLVEHKPERVRIGVTLPANATGRLPIGVGFGAKIEPALIDEHRQFFGSLASLEFSEHPSRDALANSLRSSQYRDRLLYFFCHGLGDGDLKTPNLGRAGIALADGKLITVDDLEDWLDGRDLPSEPFVFINSCQGGHLATRFHDTLALRLLEKKAIALLGSQIDLPARFAAQFAKSLLSEFLQKPAGTVSTANSLRLGDIVKTLARRFLSEYRNPLGLTYTLYRGIDCHVQWESKATV